MAPEKNLKSILKKISFTDDAQVMKQIVDHSLQVKMRMGRIRRKLVVMSGKGGVGKSMTTTNLALALARAGHRVGVLDVDLNGPCIPKMLGVSDGAFEFTAEGALPPIGPNGMKIASMAFFLRLDAPLQWKGPMELSPVWLGLQEMSVIREFLADIVWGELDYLVVDLPPGAAADKPPVIAGYIPELDGGIVVTTPSEVAKQVVRKSVVYARDVGIRLLGLVENMSGVLCAACGAPTPMFEGGCEDICTALDLPLLGKIPFSQEMSQACDMGLPLPPDHPISKRFEAMAGRIHDHLETRAVLV
jgi:ATP-binding protein involved in chromosome partitioning